MQFLYDFLVFIYFFNTLFGGIVFIVVLCFHINKDDKRDDLLYNYMIHFVNAYSAEP
jgi:hypothetical protein